MTAVTRQRRRSGNARKAYVLDCQIGFLLRQVSQRHASIFATLIGEDLTPTQWAALAKLDELGNLSQNHLGRLTAMDGATIKGVIARLQVRDLVATAPDPEDGRRLVVALTPAGRDLVKALTSRAFDISAETLAPLNPPERRQLCALLRKLL